MKKKKEEELLEKNTCHCSEDCTCGDECDCGDECNCNEECNCGCCSNELPPIEEKLVLVGLKNDQETEKAIKYLDKNKIDYAFLDLDEGKEEGFFNLDEKIEIPTLLLVQTVISGVATGLDEIKSVFEED